MKTGSLRVVALLSVVLLSAPAARAQVQIVANRGGGSPPPEDPDGRKLDAAMQAAVQIWEGILQGNRRFSFNYSYADDMGNDLARWSQFIEKEQIRVNKDVRWFYDGSPFDHSEFTFQRTLYRRPDPRRAAWIRGIASPAMELGVVGKAEPGSEAFDKVDLLTVLLREIGRHVGIDEDDKEFEVFPAPFWRSDMFLRTNADGYFPEPATLISALDKGTRKLPSTVEALAILTSDSRLTHVEMPRKYLRPLPFDLPWIGELNWMAGRPPRPQDAVYLHEESRCRMVSLPGIPLQPTTVRSLNVEDGSRLEVELVDASEIPFEVRTTCVISGAREIPSQLALKSSLDLPGPAFEAGEVLVGSGARLSIEDASAEVGLLELNGGWLEGFGRLTLDALAASGDAEIRGRDGTLEIAAVRASTERLPGRSPTIRAERGSVEIRSASPGSAAWELELGTITVGRGHAVRLPSSGVTVRDELKLGGGGATLSVSQGLWLDDEASALMFGESKVSAGSGGLAGKSSLTAFGSDAELAFEGSLEVLQGSLEGYSGARIESRGGPSNPDRLGRLSIDRATVELHQGASWKAGVLHLDAGVFHGMTLGTGASCTAEELIVGTTRTPGLGPSVGVVGRITIDDPGTELRVERNFVLGSRGAGLLRANQGRVVCANGGLVLGRFQEPSRALPDSPLYSYGSVELWEAELDVAGDVIVGHDGLALLKLRNGSKASCRSLSLGSGLGLGHVTVSDSELTITGGDLVVSTPRAPDPELLADSWSFLEVQANRLSISGSSAFVDVGSGEVQIQAGSHGLDLGRGTLKAAALRSSSFVWTTGVLDVPVFRNDGDLYVPTTSRLNGDYVQSPQGRISVYVPPTGPASSSTGVIAVAGDATLEGTVRVNDFSPQPSGTKIEIMTVAGTLQGTPQVVADLGTWSLVTTPGTGTAPTRVFVEAQ